MFVNVVFPLAEEAGVAAIEMQTPQSDIPKLDVRSQDLRHNRNTLK
jgi:hypothetical protein